MAIEEKSRAEERREEERRAEERDELSGGMEKRHLLRYSAVEKLDIHSHISS